MKKVLFIVLIAGSLVASSIPAFAQDAGEKMLGPVVIPEWSFEPTYARLSVNVVFRAVPSVEQERHSIRITQDPTGSVTTNGETYWVNLYSDTETGLLFFLNWARLRPSETRTVHFPISVSPDGDDRYAVTDENGLVFILSKPQLYQHKLTLLRDGGSSGLVGIPVYVRQMTQVATNDILTRGDTELYFDHGAVVVLEAAVPVPTPCGIDCPQPRFYGFTGDATILDQYTCEITMDADRVVMAKYDLDGTPIPTPTQAPATPDPTAPPFNGIGDVNVNGTVDIIDALLVAQYYVGSSVEINRVAADTNCDGNITIVDALLIARYYVGLINVLC